MIEIIGDVKEATEEEIKELQNENAAQDNIPEWKEKMLRQFLRGHYDKN